MSLEPLEYEAPVAPPRTKLDVIVRVLAIAGIVLGLFLIVAMTANWMHYN